MTDKWAYTVMGAIREDQRWDVFGSTASRAYDSAAAGVYGAMANSSLNNSVLRRKLHKQCCNAIAFDGRKWLVASLALPSVVLDPIKYPEKLYAYDKVNRECYFLHGYESETSHFPDRIPVMDSRHFRELHESNVIPLWNHYLANESTSVTKTVTSFRPVHAEIPIEQHVPKAAIELLRRSHWAGKPIAVEYEVGSAKWAVLEDFTNNIGNHIKTPTVTEAWSGRLASIKASHLAILGGTVMLGAVGAYWLFNKSRPSDKKEEIKAVGV